jgi:protein SCO1/2
MLLYCYHYDPVTGRYSLAVMNLIRLLGVGTVAAIAVFIVMMLRRERRGTGNALPSSPAAG